MRAVRLWAQGDFVLADRTRLMVREPSCRARVVEIVAAWQQLDAVQSREVFHADDTEREKQGSTLTKTNDTN